jgi:elongation factor P
MGMTGATEIRIGNVLRIDGVISKVIFHEIRGTGRFGRTVHLKLKSLADGRMIEKSLRAEEKVEQVDIRHVKLQYLYRDREQFIFMNNESFEQVSIPTEAIGRQGVFLKENTEVSAIYVGEQPINIEFPRIVELKVTSAPPGVKGQADTTYKEVELENGLKILAPQFVKEGELIRVNVDDFSYVDRVTTKSMKHEPEKGQP